MGFLQRLKDATIGFSGYARLGRSRWAFGFMTLILLISVVVGVASLTRDAQEFGRVAAQELTNGPDWGLVNGQFHYDGPMPAFPAENLIIDTTGKFQAEQLQSLPQGILITKDEYITWNRGQLQVLPLATVPFNFTRADLSEIMQQIHVFVPLLGVLIFLFQLGFKALDAVILAVIGQLVVKVNGRPAPFGQAYQIALYAMTIPIILQWIFGLSSIGWGFFLWWSVATLYTVGGLRACYKNADGVTE